MVVCEMVRGGTVLGKIVKVSLAAIAVAGASAGVWWWRKTSSQSVTVED